MEPYDSFSSHTSVDCSVFENAGYKCRFDEMEFNATITPKEEYVDSSYLFNGEYEYDKYGNKVVQDVAIGFKLNMVNTNGKAVIFPSLHVRKKIVKCSEKTIDRVYVKIGDNRYVAQLSGVNTRIDDRYFAYETDVGAVLLGMKDIDVFYEIVKDGCNSKVRIGETRIMELTEKDISAIRDFLSVCERAGVFNQPEFAEIGNRFSVITKFNP